ASLDDVQNIYEVSYMIWANNAAKELGIGSTDNDLVHSYYNEDDGLYEFTTDDVSAAIYTDDQGIDEWNEDADLYADVSDDAVQDDGIGETYTYDPEVDGWVEDYVYDYDDETVTEESDWASDDTANYDDEIMLLEESDYSDTDEVEGERCTFNNFTSFNYLAARFLALTGFPLDDYQKLLLYTSETIPVINLNGYLDVFGVWHAVTEDTDESDTLNDLAIVQYNNLFG
ncbi:MAG: hypothetical protein LUB61_04115, partial [Eggerthellaceae bacterium]|nr:hypothetical protein [Eggerthellaceae bacterium]